MKQSESKAKLLGEACLELELEGNHTTGEKAGLRLFKLPVVIRPSELRVTGSGGMMGPASGVSLRLRSSAASSEGSLLCRRSLASTTCGLSTTATGRGVTVLSRSLSI